jgi:hypothetical protein
MPGALDCVAVARRHRWAVVTSGLRSLALGRLEVIGLAAPRGPSVDRRDELVRVDPALRRPATPHPLDERRGVDEHAVQVEEHGRMRATRPRQGVRNGGVTRVHAARVSAAANTRAAAARPTRRRGIPARPTARTDADKR